MGGKKRKGAQMAEAELGRARDVAMRGYRGQGPSAAEEQMKAATGRLGAQMRGAYKSERSPFMRALASRQGQRAAGGMQAQSLGQLATAKAQERLGHLGYGMGASQAVAGQYNKRGEFGQQMMQAGIGAIGGAASALI